MEQSFKLLGNEKEYFYIHRHINHFEKSEAVQYFQSQKFNAYYRTMSRYKKNYLKNVTPLNSAAMIKLGTALNEDKTILELDKAFLEILNTDVKDAISEYDLDSSIERAYSAVSTIARESSSGRGMSRKAVIAFNNLIREIENAAHILDFDTSELMYILNANKQHTSVENKQSIMGTRVKNYLRGIEGKTLSIEEEKVYSIINSLNSAVDYISRGWEQTENQYINANILRGYIRNIFSTQIGEYAVAKGVMKALGVADRAVAATLKGTSTVKVTNDEELERIVNQYGQQGSQTFKTDISLDKVNVTVKDGSTFTVNLGLSAK